MAVELKDLLCDIHTHTIASGHAYGTIRENVQAGAERGLKLVGTSEHGPNIPGSCHPIYYSCANRIPREMFGVEVITGVEANLNDDGTIDIPDMLLGFLDYAIVGIHGFGYKNHGEEENTDLIIKTMAIDKVHFVAHPDTDKYPLNYERLVKAAIENRCALEMNTSSLRKPQERPGCYDNYRRMLAECVKQGCYIIVNTDAHDPSEVGRFEKAVELLNEVDFPKELILNCDLDKLKELIDYKFDRIMGF